MSLSPGLRRALKFPEPSTALGSMRFIVSTHPAVVKLANSLTEGCSTDRERAVVAFRHVRDEVPYEFIAKLQAKEYRADHVLLQGRGFCVQKAVLLAAVLRACGVPSALVLCDLQDHTMPERIVKAMGTDVMHGHGLVAVWSEGQWRLVDVSHDSAFAERKGYRLVEWDGRCDALIAATTLDGRQHAEYSAPRGAYLDLPLEQLLRTFAQAYSKADVHALMAAGLRVGNLDAEHLAQFMNTPGR